MNLAQLIIGKNHPRLTSQDLPTIWAQARMQPTPPEFSPIQAREDFPAYWLKPQDMAQALSAQLGPTFQSPVHGPALYMTKPPTQTNMDYSTSSVETPYGALFSSETPSTGFLGLSKPDPRQYTDIPQGLHHLIANAIYQHEAAHMDDPRLLPQSYNKGYLKRFGLPGNIGNREKPALMAEDKFWDSLRP